MEVFSTITSPVFVELAIVLEGNTNFIPQRVVPFETLGKMNEIRPFKLVFLLDVSDPFRDGARRRLERTLDSVIARGLLKSFDSPPAIRWAQSRCYGQKESFLSQPYLATA